MTAPQHFVGEQFFVGRSEALVVCVLRGPITPAAEAAARAAARATFQKLASEFRRGQVFQTHQRLAGTLALSSTEAAQATAAAAASERRALAALVDGAHPAKYEAAATESRARAQTAEKRAAQLKPHVEAALAATEQAWDTVCRQARTEALAAAGRMVENEVAALEKVLPATIERARSAWLTFASVVDAGRLSLDKLGE